MRPAAARRAARAAVVAALLAGCATPPAPCATANAALAVSNVDWDDSGFRVTVINRSDTPLSERVFLETALVQGGRPLLAGSTAATASWPAAGSALIPIPFTVDDRPIIGTAEVFTHLKCLPPD